MARFTLVVLAACLIAAVHSFEKRAEFHVEGDSDTLLGKAFGTGVGLLVPKAANVAACTKYGFIDDEFKTADTSAAESGIWGLGKMLADTLVPTKSIRQACISQGLYHPEKPPAKNE